MDESLLLDLTKPYTNNTLFLATRMVTCMIVIAFKGGYLHDSDNLQGY